MAPVLFLRALAAAGTAGVLVLAVNAVATIGPGSSGSAPGGIVPALADPGPVPGQPLVGDDPVTIALAGDVHFEKQLARWPPTRRGWRPSRRTWAPPT